MNVGIHRRNLLPVCRVVALLCTALAATPLARAAAGGPADRTPGSLTLARAIELALSRNQRLGAGDAAIRAAIARERQAGYLPNPRIEAEADDIGLNGDERGTEASIYAVRLAQPIELGGKRAKRRRIALLEVDLARWDLDSNRLDLAAEVKTRFIDLLAAQERVRLVAAAHEVGRKVRDTAAECVRSGKVSPLELTKAEVALTGRRVQSRRAERELAVARTELAVLWNAAPADAAALRAEGSLQQVPQLPDLPALEAGLGRNPDLVRWETEGQLAQAVVAHEQAARVPDIKLSAGIAHEQESGNEVVGFAISLPLPLFDRNRGNVAAALAEADKAQHLQRAAANALRAELAGQWQALQATAEEATSIEVELLPGARKALEAAQQAYRSGKLGYLDVLDAQQTLFEVEMQWLEALSTLHRTTAKVERLIGEGLGQEERRSIESEKR